MAFRLGIDYKPRGDQATADRGSRVRETAPRRPAGRWRVAGAALLFVLGFTVVFAFGTMAVLGLSDALLANEDVLQRLGGVITIAGLLGTVSL